MIACTIHHRIDVHGYRLHTKCREVAVCRNSCEKESLTSGRVEKTISSLDCVVNSVGASCVIDLPQTETDLWHLLAIVKLDVWDVDRHVCGMM